MSVTATGLVYNTPEVNSGTTTSWIPLNTAWPSSSGCESSFFLFPGQPYPVAWDPGLGYFAGGTPRCLPPAATTVHEQDHQNPDGFTFLSLRPIVCPSAFTTAASSIQSGSSTLVRCCPSGYDLVDGQPGRVVGTCQSSLTSGQIITYAASGTAGWARTSLAISSSTHINGVEIEGWNVAESTSGGGNSSSAGTSQSSSGLSTGAKAGIGVSAAIGAIGLVALIGAFVLFRRRPRDAPRYDAVPPLEAEARPYNAPAAPVQHHEKDARPPPVELPSDR